MGLLFACMISRADLLGEALLEEPDRGRSLLGARVPSARRDGAGKDRVGPARQRARRARHAARPSALARRR